MTPPAAQQPPVPGAGMGPGGMGPGGMGPGGMGPGSGVYRTKRTGLAFGLIAATAVIEIPMLRAFAISALASHMAIGGTIASVLMILGLPIFAFGAYAAIGGAASAPGQGVRVWFRTPLAYLPIALVIFLAAAVAAR